MRVVPSTLYQKIKFSTPSRIQEEVGDQTLAQEYYFNALEAKESSNNNARFPW